MIQIPRASALLFDQAGASPPPQPSPVEGEGVIPSGGTPIVEFRGLSAGYGGPRILHDLDLHVHEGELTAIVGPSGAGKTTMLRAMLGAVTVYAGEVRVLGQPVRGHPPQGVSYVPQIETVDWNFPVTVAEVVLMGRAVGSGPWPWASRQDRAEMHELLDRLGIAGLEGRHIRELSGGQQQRVFVARALMRRPRLLLLDEPTTGVDIRTRHDVLHLLRDLNHDGMTILMTTHDLNSVAAHMPHVVCLNQTLVAEGSPNAVFTPRILGQTYGAEMVVLHDGDLILVTDRLSATIDVEPVEDPHLIHYHTVVP